MNIEAKTIVRTTHAVQLTLDHADAQHLMTLLYELSSPNRDSYGFLLQQRHGIGTVRAIKGTASELLKVLGEAYIIPCTPNGIR